MNKPSRMLSSGNAVYISGSGAPLVVVGGGPGLSSRAYRTYLVPNIQNHQVICWDYAATGASKPREAISTANDYADFVNLVRELGLKKVSIFAHSYGALMALKYASENPGNVLKMAITGGAAAFEKCIAEGPLRKLPQLSPEETEEYFSLGEKVEQGQVTKEISQRFMQIELKMHIAKPTEEQMVAVAEEGEFDLVTFGRNMDWLSVDLTDQLEKITAQTLLLDGHFDLVVPKEFSTALLKIPNSKRVELSESAHWPFVEEPAAFARQLNDFLRS